jgi:hypothetical protein
MSHCITSARATQADFAEKSNEKLRFAEIACLRVLRAAQ